MLFIQQLGYSNITFLKVQQQENLNDSWIRWIGKLTKEELSDFPFFNENLIYK